MDTKDRLSQIKKIFIEEGHDYLVPKTSTVKEVAEGLEGTHRGLYYIWPEKNFYLGLAKSPDAQISFKRMDTHVLKLNVDLRGLYCGKGDNRQIKKEPYKQFPEGWREGVSKYLLEGSPIIPIHFKKTPSGKVKPINLDFKCRLKFDPMNLPVLLWNLNHLEPHQIKTLETKIIKTIWPFCNNETYKIRKKKNVSKKQKEVPKMVRKKKEGRTWWPVF
jgi:hypothetical protein